MRCLVDVLLACAPCGMLTDPCRMCADPCGLRMDAGAWLWYVLLHVNGCCCMLADPCSMCVDPCGLCADALVCSQIHVDACGLCWDAHGSLWHVRGCIVPLHVNSHDALCLVPGCSRMAGACARKRLARIQSDFLSFIFALSIRIDTLPLRNAVVCSKIADSLESQQWRDAEAVPAGGLRGRYTNTKNARMRRWTLHFMMSKNY